jgi:hypothetical protein
MTWLVPGDVSRTSHPFLAVYTVKYLFPEWSPFISTLSYHHLVTLKVVNSTAASLREMSYIQVLVFTF